MGVFSQLFLLLWKNVLLRVRYPGVLVLEILWPILVIGIVSVMRSGVPPIKYKDCSYQPRAMPSVGLVPFVQSFMCNLDNHCFTSESSLGTTEASLMSFQALTQELGPYLGANETLQMLNVSNKTGNAFTTLKSVIRDKKLLSGLERMTNISNYFRDPEKVKRLFVNDYKILSQEGADALFNAQINVGKLLNLTGSPDLKGIACDPQKLGSYIRFPKGANVAEISSSLCALNETDTSELANKLIHQLNITTFFRAIQLFEQVQEKFGTFGTLSFIFDDVATMFEIVMESESLIKFLGDFTGIPTVVDLIKKIPYWVNGFNDLSGAVYTIKNIVTSLEPLMASIKVENSTAWIVVKNVVKMGMNFIDIGEGRWNGTTEEFIQPITDLIQNIQKLVNEQEGQVVMGMLEFISKVDWVSVYDQIAYDKTLDERTILGILKAFQELLEKLPCWPTVKKMVVISNHGMKLLALFTEKSIDLKQAVRNLLDSNQVLVKELNKVFQNGPVITKALLQAFLDSNLIADLIKNGKSYDAVCVRVMDKLKQDPAIPRDVLQDMQDTLCAAGVTQAFTTLLDKLQLSELTGVINETITDIELLYKADMGDFFTRSVNLTEVYYQVIRFVDALKVYRTSFSWSDVFRNVSVDTIDINQEGWEMVSDILTTNYITEGLLGVYKAFGIIVVDSPMSREIAPYIYVVSRLAQIVYQTLSDLTTSYSSDSPLVKGANWLINFLPELVKGIKTVWDNKMDVIYALIWAPDPYATFCADKYIKYLELPPNVPEDEISGLVCDTNWTSAVDQMTQPVKNIVERITEIGDLFALNLTRTYNVENDWIDMVDYTERIFDLFNSGDFMKMDFTLGYKAVFDQMNFTKLGDGFDVLFGFFKEININDVEKVGNLTLKILEKLDSTYGSTSGWHTIRKYIVLFDAFLDIEINMTQEFENSKSLLDIVTSYPPEIRQIITLMAKAYPEFVTAFKNILLDPGRLIDKFLSDGFQAPDCKVHFVTDYTLLTSDSAMHKLEKYLCELNYQALGQEFQNTWPIVNKFSEKLTLILNGSDFDTAVNWEQLAIKTNKFLDLLGYLGNAPLFSDGFDFSPFNLTNIDLTWQEFYTAAETLKYFDMEKFQNVAIKVQELALKLLVNETSSDVSLVLYSYMYVTHHVLKLANTELEYFNGSTEVVMSEYLWSSELNKLLAVLSKSPDINAIGVATIQRLILSPGEITIPDNFEDLCTDVVLFSKVFAVEASPLDPAVIQKTVCDLNLDFQLILDQVQNNRPSVHEFVSSMKLLASNFTIDQIRVDPSVITKEYYQMSSLIKDVVFKPPEFKLTPNQNWMNLTLYTQEWEKLSQKLNILGQDLQNSSKLSDWESSVAKMLLTTVEKIPGAEKALGYIDGILTLLERQLNTIEGGTKGLKNYTNANLILELLSSSPEAVQTILYTVMSEPVKTTRWGVAFQSWAIFCSTPASDIMTVPSGLNFNISLFLEKVCRIDIEELGKELTRYEGIDKLERLFTYGPDTSVNVTDVQKKLDSFIRAMTDYIHNPSDVTDNSLEWLFNFTIWEEVGSRINVWSHNVGAVYSSPDKIAGMALEIIQIIFGNMSKDYTEIYEKIVGVSDIILGQVLNILNSTRLSDSFHDLPSLHTIVDLLEDLPELYETALYTSMYHPERITAKGSDFRSFEVFCSNNPQEIFSNAPGSTFDIKSWFTRFCAINITKMVDELGNYSVAKDIDKIISGPYTEPVKISSVIDKVEKIIEKFNKGIDVQEPLFDSKVWQQVMDHVNTWLWPYNAFTEFLRDMPTRWMKAVVAYFENNPISVNVFGYIDAVLDIIINQLDETQNGMQGLQNYTNFNMILNLVHSAPEAIQTILYTVMSEPIKTTLWGQAFKSWSTFCNTPANDILTVPPGLNFNVSLFLANVCKVDIEELGQEMSRYQGIDRLNALFTNGTTGYVNSSVVVEKVDKLFTTLSDIIDNKVEMQTNVALSRLFNTTIWEEIGDRIKVWANSSEKIYLSPDNIVGMTLESLEVFFGNMGQSYKGIFEKAIGVTDIIAGQILEILNSTSLNDTLHDLPNLQTMVGLVENLPELFETALYTSMYYPEKITAKVSDFTSFEVFCSNKPEDIFTLAPNSRFNIKSWFTNLCTINVTKLVEELGDYKAAMDFKSIISGSSTVKISSVIDKVEKIIDRVNQGVDIKGQILDQDIWKHVMDNVNSWIWPYNTFTDFLKDAPMRVMKSVIAYFENTPGSNKVLRYIDAVLDLISNRLDNAHTNLTEAVKEFPTLRTIIELVQQSPEMIETVVYTVLTQPIKTASWVNAFQSFSDFCNTDVSEILTVAPGSSFNVEGFIKKVCSINIDNIATEITSFEGFDRLRRIDSENDTSAINATTLLEKADLIFHSLDYYYDHPLSIITLDLPLFNETVWNNMGQRIEKWAGTSEQVYLNAKTISRMFELMFGHAISMTSELKDAYDKAVSITSVLVDEVSMVINGTSLEEVYTIPSMRQLIKLANKAPEVFETLLYTTMFHSEKVARRALSLVSFEKFCSVNPTEIFTVPPDSSFDITAWVNDLCELNFTVVETELANYRTVKHIENIVSGVGYINTSLSSVVDKIDKLVQQIQQGFNLNDHFLNGTVWTQVISRLERWVGNYTIYDSPLMNFDGIFDLIEQLIDTRPGVEEELKPFMYVGVILDNLLDKMITLENKTHFGAGEIVEGWTAMQKLLNFIQRPDVLDIIISSATSEHFLSLFLNTSSLTDFCAPNTPVTNYLVAPKAGVDLKQFKSAFCDIDFENFLNHFDDFFDTKKLERVINGTEKFNWTKLQDKVRRVTHLINDKWIQNPPEFDLPSHLTNVTYWTSLFEGSIKSLGQRLQTKEQIENIIHQLKPLLELDGFKQMGIVLNSVLDILNENLAALQNTTLTLGNAVTKIPALREFFDALGLDSGTLESLLMAPVTNLTKLAEMFLSTNMEGEFCTTNKWKEIIHLPDSFNTSSLFYAVCDGNVTPLLDNLKHVYNLQTMIDALNDTSSHLQDWDQSVDKIFKMVDYIKILTENPPQISTDSTLEKLKASYTNTTQLWKMLYAFSALHQAFINDSVFTGPFEGVFRVSNVLVNFLDEMVARVKIQNGRLDLATLFKDVPEFVKIVNGILDMNPDPLTGLFAVQLKPTEVDKFIDIGQNSTELSQLSCSQSKFREIFDVRADVDITSLLSALCAIDFGPIAEKLRETFKINTIGDDVINAWNSGSEFDIVNFMTKMEAIIDKITNLTKVNSIFFNDHDLGNVLRINATRLVEELKNQYTNIQDAFTQDYVSLSASILNSLLSNMQNETEIKTLTLSLQFAQVYLHSFNTFLRSVQDTPISLVKLLNNTEVGSIINPILNDPHILYALVNSTLNIKELDVLLKHPFPVEALCGEQLWSAIEVPTNELEPFLKLQKSICSANVSLIMWQTIMLQAKGYQLYKQLDILKEEIAQGHSSLNVSAVGNEMKDFVSLMTTIINQYIDGSRSITDLLDVKGFQDILDSVQRTIAQKLINSAKNWSVDIAELVLPHIMDQTSLLSVAKTVNTVNIFMNVVISKLQGIRNGTISSSTLFTNADGLANLIEAYIRVGKNIAQSWIDGEFDVDKIQKLFSNGTTQLEILCGQTDGIAKNLTSLASASQTIKDLSTVICSAVTESVLKDIQSFVDYNAIINETEKIWRANQQTPDFTEFANNVEEFTNIIKDLASKSLVVSSNLSSSFGFTSTLDALKNIATDPKLIFRMLKLLGIVVEAPLRKEQTVVQVLSGLNTFAIMPVVNILEGLRAKGLTLQSIGSNPETLLGVLSTMVDFDVQYSVMETVIIKSQLNSFISNRDNGLCNSTNYEDVLLSRGLAQVELPVPWKDIYSIMCTLTPDADVLLQKLKDLGLTKIQIALVLEKIMPVGQIENLPQMYDHSFGWIDLMSSLEQLSDLATQGQLNQTKVYSMKNAWEAVKDIVFDKSLKSLLSYLNLVEGEAEPNDSWVKFKQFLRFFSTTLNFIDGNMAKFAQGKVIELKDILPDSDRVASLLENVFGGSAAELLTTSINPTMFYRITMTDSWDEICHGNKSIATYFNFPYGTDIDAVKNNLCDAVTSRSTSFQQLLSLFDPQGIIKELDMLIHGEYDASAHNDTVWDALYTSVMNVIHTAESLQNVQIDFSSVDGWLTPILNRLHILIEYDSFRITGMCNSLVHYLNNTEGYKAARQPLTMVITGLNLLTDVTKLVPELDDLACLLVSKTGIDVIDVMSRVSDLGFWDAIGKAIDDFSDPPKTLDCSAPVLDILHLMESINASLRNDGLDVPKMSQCFQQAGEHIRVMLTSFGDTILFVKDLLSLIQNPALQRVLHDPNVLPIVDFILGTINANERVIISVSDLLQEKINVTDFLVNTLGLSQLVVDSFLNATVNNDWAFFLHEPLNLIVDILCDPAKLSKIISLPPESPLDVTNISSVMCNANVTMAADYISTMSATVGNITNLISTSTVHVMDVLMDLIPAIADVLVKFTDIIQFSTQAFTSFDISDIKNNVDLIDKLMKGNGLSDLANSVHKILDTLSKVLPSNSRTDMVMRDVRRILDGLLGLDIIKGSFLEEFQVKDLIKDSENMKKYLINQFGFTDLIAQEIMDAVFSSRVIVGVVEKDQPTCKDVMKMLIIMNTTTAIVQDVNNAICALNSSQVEQLLKDLTPELDIGVFIAKYVANTGKAFLTSANITSDELNEMIEKLDKGLGNLQKAADLMEQKKSGKLILEAFSNVSASSMISLDQLTPSICGRHVTDAFSFPAAPGFIVSSGDDIKSQLQKEIDGNEFDLPNEFCMQLYEEIRSSSIGSIVWAYVKPIMRGKILYTPDNEMTRAILAKANSTFAGLEELRRVAAIWAEQSSNLNSLIDLANDTEDIKEALQNDFIQGVVEATAGIKSDAILTSLESLQSGKFDLSQIKNLKTAAEIIANYSSCILTNRFQPVASESEMITEAYKLTQNKTFFAGIVFLNADDSSNAQSSVNRKRRQANKDLFPKHIGYKIRMDLDNVMDTTWIKSPIFKMTSESNFIEDLRYLRGFLYIQDMLDQAIIDVHKNEKLTSPGLNLRQMPFPCHHQDSFIFFLGAYLIPVMMTFVFLASLGVATHNLVYDREDGQEENLHVIGMVKGLNVIAWLISTLLLMGIVCIIIAVMLKYTQIFIYSELSIMFLYLLDFCFSSVMLLYMVSSFFTRTTMAILFVLIIYIMTYLPYVIIIGLEVSTEVRVMEFWHKILASLCSTTAFCFGSLRLARLEENGIGIQWSNIDERVSNELSMSWVCFMMLIDSAIYFLVGWYVRNVKPGQYGIPEPLYFPFMPSYWSSCFRSDKKGLAMADRQPNTQGSSFETPPEGYKVGIAIENLTKVYSNKKKAIDRLSISFYENQITTLLGHNGAAKTTTMKIICGVLKPTSGHVFINDQKIGQSHINNLGVCPQQNSLFYYMTVKEHMRFYAGVKGARDTTNTAKEIKKLLNDVELWHARKTPVGDLSYGMKRRLCVALAFVGGSKTIILDEPTSGVDPHARKNIWNLITRNRPGRTILLSTHHLDEADFLSDRIAVMHQGKLLCCGSPSFLKWSFGGGFNLTVVKKDQINMQKSEQGEQAESQEVADLRSKSVNNAVLAFIQNYCPDAKLIEQVGSDLTFNIPKDPQKMTVPFYQFFNQLDLHQEELNFASYGLSDTTLEEVFLKLTGDADDAADSDIIDPVVTSRHRTAPLEFDDLEGAQTGKGYSTHGVDTSQRRKGSHLLFAQIGALITKRFNHYRRNWRILISALILPMIFFLCAIGFSSILPNESEPAELVLDSSIYGPKMYSFYQDSVNNMMSNKFVDRLTNSDVGYGTACMKDWGQKYFKESTCVATTPWYNYSTPMFMVGCRNARQIFTELPVPYSVIEKNVQPNDFIQDLNSWNVLSYLLRTFDEYKEKRYGGWSFERSNDGDSQNVNPYVWFNSKGYHAMPSFYNSLTNTILRAQLPPEENPNEYGITAVNHPIKLGRAPLTIKNLQGDAADAGLSLAIVVAFSFIPCGIILYIINERVMKERQLQNISGIGVFTYWFVAYIWDLCMYAITLGIAVVILAIFKTDSFYLRDNLAGFAAIAILYGWAIIPCLYCLSHLFNTGSTAYLVSFCLNLFLALCTVISLLVLQLFRDSTGVLEAYKVCKYLYLIFPQYSLGQGLMDMATNTVIYKLFRRFDDDRYVSPFSVDVLGWKLLALAIEGVFFFILTIILDVISRPALSLPPRHQSPDIYVEDDEDVIREKERIIRGNTNDMLVVDDLSKVYRRKLRKFLPVNHISFGVREGECFGLLGVNGAGKTTTFRMLTGDLKPAGGNITLRGQSCVTSQLFYFRMSLNERSFGQNVGYCPQEGGLDEYLTGEEMLYFHSRLRGFNSDQTKKLVTDLLAKLGLKQYAKRSVHTYSGGTKRKLALAVALLGDPSILYLDEPTTGMDAGTRRLAWRCIAQANRNGQSVVLTSHSMDECDALCSIIAIMVNGKIKCIGSPQHLKHKYGDGYSVIMYAGESKLKYITPKFMDQFPGTVIKAIHHSSVELRIPKASCSVADILAILHQAQDEKMIDYYSLTQTTLDSVFVSFAQDQTDYTDKSSTSAESSTETYAKSATPSGSMSSTSLHDLSDDSMKKKPEESLVFHNPTFMPDDNMAQMVAPAAAYHHGKYLQNIQLITEKRADGPEIYITKL
ncbi:unnamed protein product [Lymnaea stagnalis]|uniref:ABC transporter domain-containing protein n=1 Tax=Lymnaea stagnalis TaxID=6523 RepID=A0AAV2H172_LYMST